MRRSRKQQKGDRTCAASSRRFDHSRFSMPVLNGLEAAPELKKLMPEVPIILFTQHGEPGIGLGVASVDKTDGASLMAHVRSLAPPWQSLNPHVYPTLASLSLPVPRLVRNTSVSSDLCRPPLPDATKLPGPSRAYSYKSHGRVR